MDFIIPFIEKTDEVSIRDYLEQRRGLLDRLGDFASTTLWLKKYLLDTPSLKPYLSEDIRKMLEDYLVTISKHGVRGLPRKQEALERTAIGFAKDSVDEARSHYERITDITRSEMLKLTLVDSTKAILLARMIESIYGANRFISWVTCLII
jgi:hypothetical protein